ncbi:MAG: GNAT family N-acetyltransferase [Thermoanaerobacterales bacterium]|nr:GNAT family N-acetyltransferase [Bacillota bacterium]MDI6906886.1 GNAT family N-acetyltransferase [Thermoanaerobacterales bacterium]
MTSDEVVIRPFGFADVDGVINLNYGIYRDEYGFNEDFLNYAREDVPRIAREFDAARHLFLVAEAQGELVGSIIVVDGAAGCAPGYARLQWFAVAAGHRGRGLGKRLVGEAIGFARRAGYRGMWLRTLSILPAAAAVYRSFGFAVYREEHNVPMGGTAVTEHYYKLEW